MNKKQFACVGENLKWLMRSMTLRIPIVLRGLLLVSEVNETKFQCPTSYQGVVNSIGVEDGSGTRYIISFKSGQKMYVQLDNDIKVQPSALDFLEVTLGQFA